MFTFHGNDVLGIDSGVQSHTKATPRLPQSHLKAPTKPPQGFTKATLMRPSSHFKARCKPGAWEVSSYSLRIPFVFPSYSLRILMVFSWYSPLVLPSGFARNPVTVSVVPQYLRRAGAWL